MVYAHPYPPPSQQVNFYDHLFSGDIHSTVSLFEHDSCNTLRYAFPPLVGHGEGLPSQLEDTLSSHSGKLGNFELFPTYFVRENRGTPFPHNVGKRFSPFIYQTGKGIRRTMTGLTANGHLIRHITIAVAVTMQIIRAMAIDTVHTRQVVHIRLCFKGGCTITILCI